MPSRYRVEVREQVVELARCGMRVARLAETSGMSEAVIYGWLKQERIDRGKAAGTALTNAIAKANSAKAATASNSTRFIISSFTSIIMEPRSGLAPDLTLQDFPVRSL